MASATFNSSTHSIFLLLLLTTTFVTPLSFNLPAIGPDDANRRIILHGNAYISTEGLQVTTDENSLRRNDLVGRATFVDPLHLWDNATGNLTDFVTHFSFVIHSANPNCAADGLAFFMSPLNSSIPRNSFGAGLGLAFKYATANVTGDPFVAVEFDTYTNNWDPIGPHVGVDVGSLISAAWAPWRSNLSEWRITDAWVSYSSASKMLTVNFTNFVNNTIRTSGIEYGIDLRKYLPEMVSVGFSAATGACFQKNNVKSWSFSSTKIGKTPTSNVSDPNPWKNSNVSDPNPWKNSNVSDPDPWKNSNVSDPNPRPSSRGRMKAGGVIGLVAGLFVCVVGLSFLGFWLRRRRRGERKDVEERDFDVSSMEMEFEKGSGPKKFSYGALALATGDFSEDLKLGEGGFGGVYRGFLKDTESYVAVKRVSKTSKQGAKEYASEVRIISRLRHRNLVQLVGWCHEGNELLLVYEYMPNGSLDSYLFSEKSAPLNWETRYKVVRGLASALLYLHEEWEQCVVHRDIKSSNIMLDSSFNAKLGDFGLARLVDHDKDSQTTVLAGTLGYMAPECVMTGKASKESDVYSFGIVALEISTGRKPIDVRAPVNQVRIVEQVWELYGRGVHLEVGDPKLSTSGGYDEKEMERLMVVGLWCANPDYSLRPSMREVVRVLGFEAEPPLLPPKMPVPTYSSPPPLTTLFSEASSYSNASTNVTSSSASSSSASAALLHSR